MSQTSQRPKKVGDLVSDKIDLSRHVEIDLAGLRHVCDVMQVRHLKSRGPGPRLVCDLVSDKSETWSPTR